MGYNACRCFKRLYLEELRWVNASNSTRQDFLTNVHDRNFIKIGWKISQHWDVPFARCPLQLALQSDTRWAVVLGRTEEFGNTKLRVFTAKAGGFPSNVTPSTFYPPALLTENGPLRKWDYPDLWPGNVEDIPTTFWDTVMSIYALADASGDLHLLQFLFRIIQVQCEFQVFYFTE